MYRPMAYKLKCGSCGRCPRAKEAGRAVLATVYQEVLFQPGRRDPWQREAARLAAQYLATGRPEHRLAFARHVGGMLHAEAGRE